MKLSYLIKGLPGHPIHPPFTDATIGTYAASAAFAVLSVLGIAAENTATAWWLALILGLIVSAPTAATGFVDWLEITWGSELWKTATLHLASMVTATIFFAIAAITGHDDYVARDVGGLALVTTLVGFGFLTLGGWLGGTVVFVHGMRVLNLLREPTRRAVSPVPKPEKEIAEGD